MSKPRKRWWGYVRRVLYAYPKLQPSTTTEQREKDAVETAIYQTEKLPDSELRLRLVAAIFFQKTHLLEGAAMREHVSYHTAQRKINQFIKLVGKYMDLD
jgi:hypothetical protein